MSTRILSVFNLLKRVGFALLLLGGGVFAQEVIWVRNGETANSHFGGLVVPMGDQNDDGFDDWAVYSGGPLPTSDSVDRFDFFFGGNPPSQQPYMTFRPRVIPTEFMLNTTPIGDFNGDGFIDWVIGYYPQNDDSISLYFYEGGLEADPVAEAVMRMPFGAGANRLGQLGDHNGDGYTDVYYYHQEAPDIAYIFFGNVDWQLSVDLVNQGEPIGSQNSQPTPNVFGDLNGDGFDDYATRGNANTFFYFGAAEPDTIPDLTWDGNFASHTTLSADVNGDGVRDLAVGGGPTIAIHLGGEFPSSTPTFILNFECSEGGISEVRSAGDYNNDGFDDLAVVSSSCPNGFRQMELFLGGFWLNPDPVLVVTGLSSPPFDSVPIWRAVGLGDVNSDGIDDLAVACEGDILDGRRGRVVILSGDTTYHVPIGKTEPILPEEIDLSVFPNPFNPTTTLSFTLPRSAEVALTIRNVLGQEVESVNFGRMSAGEHRYAVNAERWASGIYFATLNIAAQTHTTKLLLIR